MTHAERRRLLLSAAESLALAGRAMDRAAKLLDGIVTVNTMNVLGIGAGSAMGVEEHLREQAAAIELPEPLALHPNDLVETGVAQPSEGRSE